MIVDGYIWVAVAACIGFAMAFAIGANDVANAMATSVGSKVITIKQAILIAAVFEALGASMAGGQVTVTLRSGIFDIGYFDDTPWRSFAEISRNAHTDGVEHRKIH